MSYLNDLKNILFAADTFRPQSFTATGAGVAVDSAIIGSNLISAKLGVGAVDTLTSLIVKIQVATDSAFTTPVDVTGAVFTTVTAANAEEVISFQIPTAASASALPYRYVRAYATLVGTGVLFYVTLLAMKHMPNPTTGYSAAPPTIN